MISLIRRIFFPLIEKGPHKNEWLWKARRHKHISKGPPSSVLLWPQAGGLGNHVWHLFWDAFSVAPEQVWVTHWKAETWECRLCVMEMDFLWPRLGSSYDSTEVFSPCHPPLVLKHLPLWLNWVRVMKYLEILACSGKECFKEECL